jgi:thymidylate kinase
VAGILIEGVTGSGKTQTMRALIHHLEFPVLLGSGRVFDEDETFGEFMSEIQEPGISAQYHLRRLEHVLTLLEQNAGKVGTHAGFVLERFHLSYYALLPDWDLYEAFDKRLARLNCLTVLLHIPEQDITSRCLNREDRAATTWSDDMISHFGSRPAVVDAIIQSTRWRSAAARRSRLPILEIDSEARSWETYAGQIVKVWQAMK